MVLVNAGVDGELAQAKGEQTAPERPVGLNERRAVPSRVAVSN